MSEVITRARLLSNGDYGVLINGAGGGFSALRGYALTRWQPDPTSEAHGMSGYLRDLDSGMYWSLNNCALATHDDHIEQHGNDEGIVASCTIGVLSSVNAETRRLLITNRSERVRHVELTTYAELALNTPAADAAHPAFSKLFVQTGYDAERKALLAWRRLRSPDDRPLWVAQRLTGGNDLQFETDRARFIGRTRSAANPIALANNEPLSGNLGAVLDPIFSMRARIELQPAASAEFELYMCAADTREEI
jgi:cellobiose phosphorylase